MSDGPFPMLVLNRRAASNGQPYWECEMRFAHDDTEFCDGFRSLEDTLVKCRKTWGISRLEEHDDAVAQDVKGQKYYRVELPGTELEKMKSIKPMSEFDKAVATEKYETSYPDSRQVEMVRLTEPALDVAAVPVLHEPDVLLAAADYLDRQISACREEDANEVLAAIASHYRKVAKSS